MIVVDSNVIAYCWIRGERTESAQRVRLADAEWHVPILWRSEVRSALAGYVGRGSIGADTAAAIMRAAEAALQGCEHLVSSEAVLELAAAHKISAYDCEFVALARALAVPLVTEDAAILKAFPETALDMETYLTAFAGSSPMAHQASRRYGTAGRSTAIRIPAEFGIKPGEDLMISQDQDGTVRISRARPFSGFFAAVERMRAEGNDPSRDPPLERPRTGPPREVDLIRPRKVAARRKAR